jgi:phytoene dehydrogenase-like protein
MPGHRTAIDDLWHIGASTHPGPGLGAGSGYLVAKQLLPRQRPGTPVGRALQTVDRVLAGLRS